MRQRKRLLLTTQVKLAVEEYIHIANEHFDVRMAIPEISFNLGGATTAGQAWGSKWLLKFHMGYLNDNKGAYIERTVPHEVAHLVAYYVYCRVKGKTRIKPHGKEWKYIMEKVFKRPSTRCHSYKKPEGFIKNVFEYTCNCKTYELSIIRHRRALKGSVYRCGKCKQPLTFKEEI
jgi:SprT protein